MAKILAVVSGKGGVGKTVVAINLAFILNEFGRRVILVDGDIEKPNVAIYLGHPNDRPTLHDVLQGKVKLKEAAFVHHSGLKYIAGNHRLMESIGFKSSVLDEIKSEELIILDTPPGFKGDIKKILRASDYAIIVTMPDYASVSDAVKVLRLCTKAKPVGVVVNRVKGNEDEMGVKEIETVLGLPVLAVIPEDDGFVSALRKQVPYTFLHPDSKPTDEYKALAAKLLGENYEKKVMKEDKWFDYVLKRLGLR